MQAPRADLFRLLGDEDRLRLLALCAEEELTVGELATLLGESQPQVTKKSQALRDAGLIVARRDGTRTLLKAPPANDVVVDAALVEGKSICTRDGSLARVAHVVAQREEHSRRFFAEGDAVEPPPTPGHELFALLPMFGPLLPGRALAVDLGTGDGPLLPLLSPLYDRVIAVDRSPARLARAAARIAAAGLPNVRLREGDVDDGDLAVEVAQRGGADLVLMARVLHHAARPDDAVAAAARLVRRGGHLIVVDYLPHADEAMREQGDVWLGFEPSRLRACLERAHLEVVALAPLLGPDRPALQVAVGRNPALPRDPRD
ncbi:MAG: winged helix-turn-helix transcriptional regulator [Acidobacteria bacterium]|mgnify:CR=1 FL=1|nr:winged helix-turn-helix transcriptional regulator [Acidobacteriota bacterium]